MKITEIISGLKFTIEMFLFDPNTGEKLTEPRNDMDKITLDACKGAIKALEQQPCEDCISRQEALSNKHIVYDDDGIGYSVVRVDEIMALPSVQPTRPTGKWIVYDVVKFGDFVGTEKYECSKCHHRVGVFKSNFCPNCGARMAEVEPQAESEEEDD